ncbi:MAG: MFS transporter, partial [Kiritimatiellae bacterium]|nr:MFS transporter [Kiritimatiellia bacterium]
MRRLTVVSWLCLLVFAGISAVISTALEEIGSDFQIGLSRRGGLALARSAMFAVAAFGGGVLADRIRKTRLLCAAMIVTSLALVFSSLARSYTQMLSSMLIMGLGLGIVEGVLSPLTEDLHPERVEEQMNILHGFYPVGLVAVSVVAGGALRAGIGWRWILLAIAGPALLVAFMFGALRSPAPRCSGHSLVTPQQILKKPAFWGLALAMCLTAGVEGAVTFWAPSFVRAEYRVSALSGASAMAAFGVAMAVGRFATGWLVRFVSLERLMIVMCIVCAVAAVFLTVLPLMWLTIAALAVIGFSVASFWPGILALAARRVTSRSATLMAMLAVAGIIGFGGAPSVLGALGDRIGLRPALLVLPIFLSIAGLVLAGTRSAAPAQKSRSGHP